MSEPTTPTGKALWVQPDDMTRDNITAIEQEAAAAERERLRALYMATDAGKFCDIDVLHTHAHESCNARCWCSWADPENCPYPEAPTDE